MIQIDEAEIRERMKKKFHDRFKKTQEVILTAETVTVGPLSYAVEQMCDLYDAYVDALEFKVELEDFGSELRPRIKKIGGIQERDELQVFMEQLDMAADATRGGV